VVRHHQHVTAQARQVELQQPLLTAAHQVAGQ